MTTDPGHAAGYELPMFPLGTVLLPGMALPLRVFEPRYVTMMSRVLDADPPAFGVALIERGSEVGGGDVRTDVACVARVHSAEVGADGHVMLLVVGTHRIRVLRWLPDDPYPVAVVTDWPDESPGRDEAAPDLDLLTVETLVVAESAARLGGGTLPGDLRFSDDPAARVFQLATIAPLGPLDRLRVLAAASLAERVAVLGDAVHEQRILLEARERFGDR